MPEDNKPRLELVKAENSDTITETDANALDLDKLRQTMFKNIYIAEAALFQQAGEEYSRVGSLRGAIDKLEADILSDESLQYLSPGQKIKLYGILAQNKNASLDFLQKLHSNIASGIDTLTHIEKMKTSVNIPKNVTEDSRSLEEIRKIILQKIREKSGG